MIDVIYQDEQLVAINKPAGAVVHRTRGAGDALILVEALTSQLGRRVFPVHRLDRQTSGVIVFALERAVAIQLSADIREQLWKKKYLGLARGVMPAQVVVDHPVPEKDKRRPASTEFLAREIFCRRYTLVEARPATGRRHQVRYHLKHLSHPLVCDVKYGKGDINRFFRGQFGLDRLFLHASRLALPHPSELRMLELEAPLSLDLDQVLAALRAYSGPVV